MTACVEVTLDEFDIEDIIEYLEDRGYEVKNDDEEHATEDKAELERIWAAIRLGRHDEALGLMQTYVCDKLGRVI
jgi:hypothetical protein